VPDDITHPAPLEGQLFDALRALAARSVRTLVAIAPACLAALLYARACPPVGEWWLAWAAPALLLVPARRLSVGGALGVGVLFGMLIGAAITSWALPATLVYFDADRIAASSFVLLVWLLCSGLPYGLLTAAYAAAARRVPRATLPLVAAVLLVLCEMLRANPWLGMPWELLAHSQWQNLRLLQVADLGGMYAVSFVVALVSVAVGELIAGLRDGERPAHAWRRLVLPCALLAAVLLYGESSRRLDAASREVGAHDAARVTVVQGNVANAFRWRRALFERALAAYARLTDGATGAGRAADLVVWPENAVGFYLDGEPQMRAQIGAVAARAGGALLLGAPRSGDAGYVHNSAYVLDQDGDVRGSYDKRRLVPFAEYDPLAAGAPAADAGELRYAAGGTPGVLDAAGLRLGTLICYEILFPELVRDTVRNGADVLVNLSNDAWLSGEEGGAPQQHLSMAVFRAIETRRFLIRAASSGISGFVTPYGEAFALLPIGAAGATTADVAPRRELTVYVRWGETWVLVLAAAVVAAVLRGREARS
jgi:apolipoprotein N-acyltransferase